MSIAKARSRPKMLWALGFGVWGAAVLGGMGVLWAYSAEAGSPLADSPPGAPHWQPTNKAALLMFAHPHCPCTRASVNELDRLMARLGDRVEARVLAFTPRDEPLAEWSDSDLWRSAERIPGVSVLPDLDGEEARRYGAATSGSVVVYSSGGRHIFSGGITPGRGHEGDNAGRTRVTALLEARLDVPASAPIFGCDLTEPELADTSKGKAWALWQ